MADLRTLDRRLFPLASRFVEWARQQGFNPTVTSATRSRSKQARLHRAWLRGESSLPALPPGRSLHEKGLAFDMVTEPRSRLRQLGGIWESLGGQWGGRSKLGYDPVHFQWRL